jgi:pimeloyl-ACP methyl ester carboxylesterase
LEYSPQAAAKALAVIMQSNPTIILTADQIRQTWKFLLPRQRRRILALHLSRGGGFPPELYASAVTEAAAGNCGLAFCLPPATESALPGLLIAAAVAAEAALGVTDKTRSSPFVDYVQQLPPWQFYEGLDPFPPPAEIPAPPALDTLRRLELLSDLLTVHGSTPAARRVAKIFGLCVLPALGVSRPAADMAALGTHARGLRLAAGGPDGARLAYNLAHARLPLAPRLRDGLVPMGDRIEADTTIVCIHGLQGAPDTWFYSGASETVAWPGDLLEKKFPGCKVLSFIFDAPLWGFQQPESPYHEVSAPGVISAIAERLASVVESARPTSVIFICYSMGGLVTKSALVSSAELRAKTAGVVFFATPHLGSSIADFASTALVPPFVAELSTREPQLAKLNDDYLALKLPTLNIYETASSDLAVGWHTLVVPKVSAIASGGEAVSGGEAINHYDISKLPRDQANDPRTAALVRFLTPLIPQTYYRSDFQKLSETHVQESAGFRLVFEKNKTNN